MIFLIGTVALAADLGAMYALDKLADKLVFKEDE